MLITVNYHLVNEQQRSNIRPQRDMDGYDWRAMGRVTRVNRKNGQLGKYWSLHASTFYQR